MIQAEREAVESAKDKATPGRYGLRLRSEGIHKYPAALDDPKLATGG